MTTADAILRELLMADDRAMEMYHNDAQFKVAMDGIVATLPALVHTVANQCAAAADRRAELIAVLERSPSAPWIPPAG